MFKKIVAEFFDICQRFSQNWTFYLFERSSCTFHTILYCVDRKHLYTCVAIKNFTCQMCVKISIVIPGIKMGMESSDDVGMSRSQATFPHPSNTQFASTAYIVRLLVFCSDWILPVFCSLVKNLRFNLSIPTTHNRPKEA